ncbi:Hpt domain-containing protein [Alteromonas sp. 1_MG-2023]|uniref:Hpt domain-containing protein n=1 Tax=Alteromonas sp. 1_MG-2023 TaxID=3062669 RepID=UPI0026E18E57|nr:Hpt domain-containing protein [Alteromonas sp. 1_MG-2023]MDO6567457.1 Hpt domain-containing protein [Alteromonas sp. 1_MG-2023]
MTNDSFPLWQKENALQRLAGNHALLNRVVEMFINQIDEKYVTLTQALIEKNQEKIRFTSHAIKGVSGDVGADRLRHYASLLELLSATDNWAKIEEEITSMASVINATKSEMTDCPANCS